MRRHVRYLNWREFNEKAGELRVQRALVLGKGQAEDEDNTVRDIELAEIAFAVIIKQNRAHSTPMALSSGTQIRASRGATNRCSAGTGTRRWSIRHRNA
jgi:hypothetical protein